MSLANIQKRTALATNFIMRPAQNYLVAAPGPAYTIFSVENGAIEILTLGGRVTAVGVGATTIRITANTINTDAGAIAVGPGAIGQVFLSCNNVGGVLIGLVDGVPQTVATLTTMICGTQPAGPGLIVATFGVGTNWVGEIFMVYRRLSPNTRVY